MAKQLHYNTADHISSDTSSDPYLHAYFSTGNKLRRLIWNIVWLFFYRTSPRLLHFWRVLILRAFGAKVGPNCHFYPASRIWAPWNLTCSEQVTFADGAEIYNPAPIYFGSHVIVSQSAYICGATHDFENPAFPLLAYSMKIGSYAWICARAAVCPGVNVGEYAVLGLGSVAARDLDPWGIYAGVPAVKIKTREFKTSAPKPGQTF